VTFEQNRVCFPGFALEVTINVIDQLLSQGRPMPDSPTQCRTPIIREVRADLDTPLSAYLKLANQPNSFLLESVEGGDRWSRYSIIGLPAKTVYRLRGSELRIEEHGVVVETRQLHDPLAELARIGRSFQVDVLPGLPVFSGGLVGYFGFESLSYVETKIKADANPDELGLDDVVLMLADELAVFDLKKGVIVLIVHADPGVAGAHAAAERRLDQLTHQLRLGGVSYPDASSAGAIDEADFRSGFTETGFKDAVRACQEYILAGDAFQVVLSQRMSVPFSARPLDVYRALRATNPSPYMFMLNLGDTHVVGASPEILFRCQDHEVTVRPIAGTALRGATPALDEANAQALLSDPKELAEHLMLIDLGRNDVGRVALPGTVRVPDQMVIERYSHVMHIVSQVVGTLKPGLDSFDVFRACFPAGTLSGAPKVRAVEIIQALEPVKRNLYGGAVGYINWRGESDLAIAIRTAVIKGGRLSVQAGAGIVADSDPQKEWDETMSKGRAVFRAVAQASRGL
jgi:anthranilate synthase component I